jgi:SAM-dependent methyltransferase
MMQTRSKFIGLPLTADTQDIFWMRNAIEGALRAALPRFHGTLLDVGCGVKPYEEILLGAGSAVQRYIGLDLAPTEGAAYAQAAPDITWDGTVIPMDDASVDSVMATEVLEHCPEPGRVLSEIFRVLRPGGTLFLTVPFLWPLHDMPYDEYRYTPFSLERIMRTAGFTGVELKPTGGWNASLAQMIGLYVERAPMGHRHRRFLRMITFPLVRRLIAREKTPDVMQGPMITGLSALAVKPS